MKSLGRRFLKLIVGLSIGLASLLALYLLAALAGACWPRNTDFVPASEGVRIWVTAGPIHTDVVVPVKNEVFDWSTLVDAGDANTPDDALDHLAIGWGDRKFYLETPSWHDVKLRNVVSAFCGLDATAMHVEWCSDGFEESPDCRSLILTPTQYARLCEFVQASFCRESSGRAIHINAPGYRATDAFYEAEGRYSAARTCNTWTGDALAAGGAKVGIWTPTTWGVMWQLPQPACQP